MTYTPLVSVVVVLWNSKAVLPLCLEKLSNQTFQDFEVILVDNGSDDGAVEEVKEKHLSIDLRSEKLNSNHGFAFANNRAAQLARGKWLALLNTDAFPEPDWLEKLLQASDKYSEYSFFSSRQIQANNPSFLDGAGDAYHVSGLAWKLYLGYPAGQYGLKQTEVFSSCGAAALFPRQAFLDINGFDEDFFSYLEDVDLGFRLRLQGYRCLYVPDAVVYHVGSATLGVASDFALYHYHRNLIWSFVQNMPSGLLWKYLLPHIIANIIYVIYYTVRGRGKIMWRAKFDAIRGISKALRKRREIQSQKKVTNEDLLHVMEKGWLQPYLLEYNLRKVLRNQKS